MVNDKVGETMVCSSKANVVAWRSCHRAAKNEWQIVWLDEEVHETEVHDLENDGPVDVEVSQTVINQVVTLGCLG